MLRTSSASAGVQPGGVSDFGQSVFLFVGVGTWVVGRGEPLIISGMQKKSYSSCVSAASRKPPSRVLCFLGALGAHSCVQSGAAACQATVEESGEEREMKRFCSEAPPQKQGRGKVII